MHLMEIKWGLGFPFPPPLVRSSRAGVWGVFKFSSQGADKIIQPVQDSSKKNSNPALVPQCSPVEPQPRL